MSSLLHVAVCNVFQVFACRSQWPRGLRRGSATARLLRQWVRIPQGCIDVCLSIVCCSGRGLCDGLITRPEESLCDLETSWMSRPWPTGGGGCRSKRQINRQTNKGSRPVWSQADASANMHTRTPTNTHTLSLSLLLSQEVTVRTFVTEWYIKDILKLSSPFAHCE